MTSEIWWYAWLGSHIDKSLRESLRESHYMDIKKSKKSQHEVQKMWQQKWKIKVRDEEIFQTCLNDNKNMLQRQTSYKLWSFVTHKLLTFEICWYACLSSRIGKSLRESPRESLRKSHNIGIYSRVTEAVKFHPLDYIKNRYTTVITCPQCKTYPKHMS